MRFSRGVEAFLSVLRNKNSCGDQKAAVEELESRRLLSVFAGLTGNSSVNEGQTYTLSLSGAATSPTPTRDHWTINWGEGSPQTISGTAASVTHIYADGNASKQISASLIASGTGTFGTTYATSSVVTKNVTVNDVTLTGSVWAVNTAYEHNTFTLSRSYSDVAADPATKWVIDWGDGSGSTHGSFFGEEITGNPSTFKHVYASGGNYTVAAVAYNKDETSGHALNSFSLTVHDLEYVVAIDDNGGIMGESDGTLDFTLRRTLPAGQVETERYSIYVHVKASGIEDEILNSADDSDYEVVMNDNIEDEGDGFYKVTFDPNEDTATLSIMGTDDSDVETQEWFKVVITSVDATGHTPTVDSLHSQSFGGIDDDDQVVSIAVDDGLASEDGNIGKFVVTRGPDASAALNVPIVFSGAAVKGTDYTTSLSGGASPYVHFNEDETQVIFSITPIDDAITENAENVVATLGAPGPDDVYTVNQNHAFATVTITDEAPAAPSSPTDLRATALSRSEVELAWKLPGGGGYPTGFVIEVSTDNGQTFTPYQQVDDPSARSAVVTGLDPQTPYVLQVDAAIDDQDGNMLGDDDDIVSAGEDPVDNSATTTNDQWEDIDTVTADVAGNISWFNGGDDLAAGSYRMLYEGGAVNFDHSEEQDQPTWLVNGYSNAIDSVEDPTWDGGQPYPGNHDGMFARDTEEEAEYDATPTLWGYSLADTGPLGVGLYGGSEENSGPGVTWKLQRFVPHVSLLTSTAASTEGDDAHPAQLYFKIDDNWEGHHYDEPLTVKFDLNGSATEGADAQYTAVMLIPDGNGGNTQQAVNLSSGQFTIPANISSNVEIDITAINDTVLEWTKDLNLRLKDDLPHYVVDHYVDSDGVDTNGAAPDPDGVVFLKDNDNPALSALPEMTQANSDDDDRNGIPDYYDTAPLSVTGDDDLIPLSLTIPTEVKAGTTATLSINTSKLRVWKDANKSELYLDGSHTAKAWTASDMPTEVYAECIDGGAEVGDIELTLSISDSGPNPTSYNSATTSTTGVRVIIVAGEYLPPETQNEVQNRTVNKLVGAYNHPTVQVIAPDAWVDGLEAIWDVGDGAFSEWRADGHAGVYTALDPNDDLTTSNHEGPVFYYKSAGAKTVKVTVSVNDVPFSCQYEVDTSAPIVTQTSLTFGTPQIWQNAGDWEVSLHGLTRPGTTISAGVLWGNTVDVPSGFRSGGANYHGNTAVWNYVQLVDSRERYNETLNNVTRVMSETVFGQALDSAYPMPSYGLPAFNGSAWTGYGSQTGGRYVSGWTAGTTGTFTDEPMSPLTPGTTGDGKRQDVFETYIMFNPGGFGDMWVPVKVLKWHWSAYWKTQNVANQPPYTLVSGSPAAAGYTGDSVQGTNNHPIWDFNGGFDNISFPDAQNAMMADPDQSDPNNWTLPPIP